MKDPIELLVKRLAYLVSWILIRIAPEDEFSHRKTGISSEEDAAPPEFKPHGDRLIRFAVFLYKRSWIRKHLHQGGKGRCRFIPSCSDYCVRAVRKHGLKKGLILTGGRLKRCNPHYQGDSIDFP